MVAIHKFASTWDAYNKSQTGYVAYPEGAEGYEMEGVLVEVEDGDIMIVESEKVIGFMMEAWPVALTEAHGQFGVIDSEEGRLHYKERYSETFAMWNELPIPWEQ